MKNVDYRNRDEGEVEGGGGAGGDDYKSSMTDLRSNLAKIAEQLDQ